MYFEDFYQGYSFGTNKKTITKKDIISFAEKWDYQSFHLNEKLAKRSHYSGLIASGWQTLMIAFTLILDTQKISKCSMGSPGLDKVNWFKPVRPNDTIHCIVTVKSSRRSRSKPFGVTTILVEVFNQEKELVADMTAVWFLKSVNSDK
jgi:acyl dehydratase|tara:strand:- start:122 stop:565 length:444 start_codon:yes stop_codon:yes gene_type:complete